MRLTKPRFAPLSDAELTPEQAEALEPMRPGPVLNIFRTLARAPKALTRFNAWGGYVLSRRNDLPAAGAGDRHPAHRLPVQIRLRVDAAHPHRPAVRADRGRDPADQGGRGCGLERGRRGADPRHRRAARRPVRRRGDLGAARRALHRQAAHGPRLHRRPVHPGLDDPEHLRRAARRRPDPRPGPREALSLTRP